MSTVRELCKSIESAVAGKLREETGGIHKPSGFRASELGQVCARAQYHGQADWDKRPAPDDRLAATFALGRELEGYVDGLLRKAGYPLMCSQVAAYDARTNLVGRIDGILVTREAEYPVEIKSINTHDFDRITCYQDFCRPEHPWMLRWALQLPAYMWLHDAQQGLYVLVDKANGRLKVVPVHIDEAMDLLDAAFATLDEAKAALERGTPPEPKPWHRSLCRYCWCREVGLCPGVEEPAVADVVPAELAQYAEECAQLYDAYQRYNRAHKALSDGLKCVPVAPGDSRELFIGTVPVRISCYRTTTYEIPKEIKDQYARTVERRRVELLGVED